MKSTFLIAVVLVAFINKLTVVHVSVSFSRVVDFI